MTRFDVLKSITGINEFAKLSYEMVTETGSPEKFAELLRSEIPKEGLQTLMSIAQSGNYPLSFNASEVIRNGVQEIEYFDPKRNQWAREIVTSEEK